MRRTLPATLRMATHSMTSREIASQMIVERGLGVNAAFLNRMFNRCNVCLRGLRERGLAKSSEGESELAASGVVRIVTRPDTGRGHGRATKRPDAVSRVGALPLAYSNCEGNWHVAASGDCAVKPASIGWDSDELRSGLSMPVFGEPCLYGGVRSQRAAFFYKGR